jgi:hypothetical protein
MKVLICLSVLIALAVAGNTDFDASTLRPIWEIKEFQDKYPILKDVYSQISSGPSTFVAGGEEATQGQFPYVAGFIVHFATGNGWCSGSVVSDQYLITAAHCLADVASGIAIVNALNISNPQEPGQIRLFTTNLLPHPQFDSSTGLNDIGLVRFGVVSFDDVFRPIRLPNRRQVAQNFVNQLATIVGWGATSQGSSTISPVPNFVRNPIITNLSCRISLVTATIDDNHICMSGEGGRNPCAGDSGAPLTVTEADGLTTQIGVFSFNSILGCQSDRPSVYTRLTVYLDWIEQNSNVEISAGWD